ncbi:MAG TPA: glutaredoxin 3 [Acidiferrobacteraceae bacterium]|nr:glutaredoxin 3 [Acidiferrobacteraceae bacterium]
MASPVLMYRTRFCPYCIMAGRLLKSKDVKVQAIHVDRQPELRLEMERLSGRHTVPQIFVGDNHIGGYSELAQLERGGELDSLLGTQAGTV